MKLAFIHFALVGLSSARLAIMDRAPPGTSTPANLIKDAIINGIKDWGPAGSLKPPTGQNPPIKNMLGAVPSYHKSKDPNRKTGVSRVPGQPLGPAKKCRPCKKREICCGGRKPTKPTPKRPSRVSKGTRPAWKLSRFKVPKAAGKAGAFSLAAPHVHKAYDSLKNMDNPVGQGLTKLDDGLASLQESIGGPQRDDIYGNELKHKMVKFMGKALQMGFETTWDRSERLRKEARAGEEARRQEEAKEKERIKGLEALAAECDVTREFFPNRLPIGKAIRAHCNQVATALRKIQAQEVAKSRTKRAVEPDYWFEQCKCNRSQLPELGAECGDECRVIITLTGP